MPAVLLSDVKKPRDSSLLLEVSLVKVRRVEPCVRGRDREDLWGADYKSVLTLKNSNGGSLRN